jgi:ribose transport system ATP-binding protein
MTGRAIEYAFPPRPGVADDAAPVLQVESLSRTGEFADVSFEVRAGEVVGLAGLVGAGRSEILETVFGARRQDTGTVTVDGRRVRPGSVGAAVSAGIGLCPEERKSQALLLGDSVAANIGMASLTRFARGGFLDREAERRAATDQVRSLDVRPHDVGREMRTLSGGNQQKVVLARWLLRGCRVLLLDEPTRGVDVGARSEIYALVRRLADDGVAVVVVSSEIEEVLGLADRVLVVGEGAVLHDGPAADIDEHAVLDIILRGDAA